MSAYHENALQLGSTLADYTIESVLGYGGFGITYLGRDKTLGAHVAIKEYLPQEIAVRGEHTAFVIPRATKDAIRHYHWGLKNFVKEARALARFKHTNIVRVLRFIEANGTAYTVMEYEQGQTLAQYLKDMGQKLDESNLLRIVMPILNGLHAVHEVGLLHLDIKPENIYLRRDGSPMLIDFGSARHALTESRPSGRVTLTHGYAPIEQYPDKGKLGPWSDVYALGATMYRCLAGKRPEDSLDRYRTVLDYKTDPLKPAIRIAAGRCRLVILECVDRAMQIHAKDRPQSAREFQDVLLGRPAPARASSAPVTLGTTARVGKSRKERGEPARTPPYFLVLLLIILASALVWLNGPDLLGFGRDLIGLGSVSSLDAPPRQQTVRPARSMRPPADARSGTKAIGRESKAQAPLPSSLRSVLSGHSDWVQAVVFAPGGRRLATASNDRTVRIWDIESGALLGEIKQQNAVNAIAYAPDGRTLATAGTDGAVQIWETRNAQSIGRFEGNGYPLFTVAYAPDGRTLAAAGKDRTLYVWNVANGSRRVFEGHRGDINAIAFRPDGKSVVSAGADRSIRIWDVSNGQELGMLSGHKDTVLAVAFSPDGRWLASGDAGRAIRLWDMRTLTLVRTFSGADQAILSLAFARDGSWLAAGAADNAIYLYDVETGRVVQTLNGHEGYVQAVAVSPNGLLLASGSRDQRVRLWEAASN